MLYINPKNRAPLENFRKILYNYIKENGLKYSDQRERVLKILYEQSYPVSIDFLVKKLNEQTLGAGYATVSRNIKLFHSLEMLLVVNKVQKGYLLKKEMACDEVEVHNEYK